ncbi:DUF4345 domain-containing protein [Cytophagaceae bacterium DM2B3-1]|uniref:DUF4345 domain-containing protein n=1 Tax=Xanthocytophaga flava TaxID=3048013 RepID=A0ABT7CWK9_9BACT|nr:DUF4345 domain-containing protein [Xanthocytophaga flavus]MDJ1498100.1 DUF4345 domain-containing protein [Xanthocytophaga flavus]
MKQSIYSKILLFFAGIIGIAVGIGQLIFPVAFEASTGIDIAGNSSLLSEIRGSGGTLLIAGVVMVLGAFKPSLSAYALFIASLFYLCYGLSRIYGMLVDGLPHQGLVVVTICEIVIGIAVLAAYRRLQRQ